VNRIWNLSTISMDCLYLRAMLWTKEELYLVDIITMDIFSSFDYRTSTSLSKAFSRFRLLMAPVM